jgi:hypothetical protein
VKREFAAFYPQYPGIHDITMIIHRIKARDIDSMVLHYMHKHGIDRVRGGSYTNVVFSDELKSFIAERIKYTYYDLPDMHNMLTNYDTKHIESVVAIKSRIAELTPCLTKNEFYMLSQMAPVRPASQLYNNLVYKCSNLYYQFRAKCPDGMNDLQKLLGFESHIWLYSPHVALDSYFIDGTDKALADKVLRCIDFMMTYMLNRIDELEFDITTFQSKKTDSAALAIPE